MKIHLNKIILLIMTIMLTFQSIAYGEDIYSDVSNSAEHLADVLVSEYGVSGIQYALISDGEIVLSGTSGIFNKDKTGTLDNQSLFGIGSISKMFTATAVMILSDQGKINLDEPVTNYVPEFKMADPRYEEITVRMLLNHSSGIMGSNFLKSFLYDYPSTFAHDNLLAQLAKEQLKAAPGEFSSYCNDGFTLVEIIVEKVSGMSFSEFIRKNITEPLGMNNTYTPMDDFDRNRLVRTFVNGEETPVDTINVIGTGGIYSTAEDLCCLGQAYTNDPGYLPAVDLLSQDAKVMTMQKEYKRGFGPDQKEGLFGYGLGWDSVDAYPYSQYDIQSLIKGGDTQLYHGSMIVLPEYNMVFAALLSGGSSLYGQVMGHVLLLETLLAENEITEIIPSIELQPPVLSLMPQELTSYSGLYSNNTVVVNVSVETDGKIDVTSLSDKNLPDEIYIYTAEGVFVDENGSKQLSFIEESNGKTYIQIKQIYNFPNLGQTILTSYQYEKTEPNNIDDRIQGSWDERSGTKYYLVNEHPHSQAYHVLEGIYCEIITNEELPGYVGQFKIIDEYKAIQDIQIPSMAGRDLADIEILNLAGKEYLISNDYIYMKEKDRVDLYAGQNAICTIREDGYARWYTVNQNDTGKTMIVDLPENGSFAVYNEESCIYFSVVDGNKSVVLPENGKIVFIGQSPGDRFIITTDYIKLSDMTDTIVQEAKTYTAEGYEATIEAARKAVAKELSTGIPSSATVAIMVDGEIVYAEGFCLRDRAENLTVDTKTQFNIGSVSKIFTAASVLILEQEGELSLDKPVTDYLPDFTMNDSRYKEITIRMLLNHTSGLPGTNMKDGFTAAKNRDYVKETLESLKTMSLVNDPGQISIYCNDGFTVAEAVIEHVSGMSFPDFLDQKIFSKLGLENTSAYFKDGNENIARVYELDSIVPLPVEYVNILGSGGLASTAIDLCKYGEIIQSETVLSKAMIEEYTKAQYGPGTVPVGEPLLNVGLGWDYVLVQKFKNQGIDVLAKSGGTLQYNSQLYVVPKEHISVAVIFAGFADPTAVTDTILQTLLEEKGIVKKPSSDEILLRDAEIPDSFKNFEGYYTSRDGIRKVEISPDKTGIILSIYDGEGFKPAGILTYKEDGRFYRQDGISYSIAEHGEGKVIIAYPYGPNAGIVQYEMLNNIDDIDTSAFSGKVWVPRNHGPYDFFVKMYRTETIPEIPGYIFINDGETYTPLALKGPTETRMSFNYIRDQYEILLQNIEGETLIYSYGNYYSDASELPVIADGDILQINSEGNNKAGMMRFSGLVGFSIPEEGRILVFSPKFNLVYDSLVAGSPVTYAEKGAYVIAIGKPGDAFKIYNYDDLPDYRENTISFESGEAINREQAISIIADVMDLAGFETNLNSEEE